MINVFILTFCRNLDLFYGTELIFRTLRVGFPNAKITICDNASIPEARAKIEFLSKENDCIFEKIPQPGIQHHEFIENSIRKMAFDKSLEGPLVFLDPDICLWRSCEDFAFDGIIAGKVAGKFKDYLMDTITMPRIHTSFLWIPDAKTLWREIWKIKAKRFDFEPFRPFAFFLDGTWYRYDTGGSLFAVLSEKVSEYTEKHFSHYDHIYAGSHLDWLYPLFDKDCQEMFSKVHGYAKASNLKAIKGIWRYQEEVFQRSFGEYNF